MELEVVDRDDPTEKWGDEQDANISEPIYAGESTGDMVRWSIGDGALSSLNFTWTAEGPNGETKTGPTGVGKDEWKIANGGSDTSVNWLDWKPGVWEIKVVIGSAEVEFKQEIGWRTDDLLVVGQIVPTQTHISDEPSGIIETFQYERAIMNDVGIWGIFVLNGTFYGTTTLWTQALFKYWGEDRNHSQTPKGPFTTSYPDNDGTVLEKHRYWAVNYMINLAPDIPAITSRITKEELPNIIQAKQFRIFHQYQIKFLVTESGRFNESSVIEVQHEANKGITKIVGGVLANYVDIYERLEDGETVDLGPLLQIRTEEAEVSTTHDARTFSPDGTKQSNFASARIGEKGRNANWRIFGKDAPWIFSEIIHEIKSDRTVEASLGLSVDVKWKDGEVEGATPFNNMVLRRFL
jgi:hypothetical protein